MFSYLARIKGSRICRLGGKNNNLAFGSRPELQGIGNGRGVSTQDLERGSGLQV